MDLMIRYLNPFVSNRGMRRLKGFVTYIGRENIEKPVSIAIKFDSVLFDPSERIRRMLKGKKLNVFLDGLKRVDLSNTFESDIRVMVKAFSTIYEKIGEREAKLFLKKLSDFILTISTVEGDEPKRVVDMFNDWLSDVYQDFKVSPKKLKENVPFINEEVKHVKTFVDNYLGWLNEFGLSMEEVYKAKDLLQELERGI